ncbi:MAG: hypothetical protein GY810_04395 [Aureispira sp.]|nr:hypothetical protein [Aureispira sp.]
MNIKLLIILTISFFLLSSCKKELIDADEQLLIENYLANKGITAVQDAEAGYYLFYYKKISETDGTPIIKAVLNKGIEATVNYKASLLDDTVIHETDSASSEKIVIDEAIAGLQLVLTKMALGEQVLVVLPSRLAYGSTSLDNVPTNSILVFEIELLDLHPHF